MKTSLKDLYLFAFHLDLQLKNKFDDAKVGIKIIILIINYYFYMLNKNGLNIIRNTYTYITLKYFYYTISYLKIYDYPSYPLKTRPCLSNIPFNVVFINLSSGPT